MGEFLIMVGAAILLAYIFKPEDHGNDEDGMYPM
tara:strand:- start:888 stop:989 length:102 start_codon:yes stop_codon:yes gene_type:complete